MRNVKISYMFFPNLKINLKILANHCWTDVQMPSFKFISLKMDCYTNIKSTVS